MRKNITIVFSLFIALTFTSGAWAVDIGSTSNPSGAALSFDASPNVNITAAVTATEFTILSYSTKVDDTNGMEYAMISGDGYIYQMKMGTTPTSSAGTAGSLPSTDFVAKGGSSSGS